MQKINGTIFYSASDIVNFLDCEHRITLDLINLETPLPQVADVEEAVLYQTKGTAHETAYVDHLRQNTASFVDISPVTDDIDLATKKTREAMYAGAELIYQATLLEGAFLGHADLLKKVPSQSGLGNYGYEVVDTKLSRNVKARYIIQLCFYSELVAGIQQKDPSMMHIVFGDGREESFRYADFSRYYRTLKEQFKRMVQEKANDTYPEVCESCGYCRWRDLCNERWNEDDHLNQIADITRLQIKKLHNAGITTLGALAKLKENVKIPKMASETLLKLRHQALLQLKKRQTGKNHFDLLPIDPEKTRGFARLPKPDRGDIFFDLEGDPLEGSGLEYLFGIYYFDRNKPIFKSIWAHTKNEEKIAFSQFIDFVKRRLKRHPEAHIYHYGHYEEAALKRLMSFHGIHETEVDNLLRQERLVNLYKVVREGLRISEQSYSLKNVENFYLHERKGEIKDAGSSIVCYEKWRETNDPEYLKKIEEYNHEDLISTYRLREWLLSIRPKEIPWYIPSEYKKRPNKDDITALTDIERKLLEYRERLIDSLPESCDKWTKDDYLKELTYFLLDFHRRAEKPVWWALFNRRDMTEEELIEDPEAIGGMTLIERSPFVFTYRYPEQETKLKTGDDCVIVNSLQMIKNVIIDEDTHTVTFTLKRELPEKINISTGLPVRSEQLRDALFRFADSIINNTGKYQALEAILLQKYPRVKTKKTGELIINESEDEMSAIIDAVANLDNSYIFIQGPPGTGKTYTGSHIIVEFIKKGYSIGVSSNSHKAINNLLSHVERVALQKGVQFNGVKKSNIDNDDTYFNGRIIIDVFKNCDALTNSNQLIAGTAWLFSDEIADQKLDFLFVDEAGQVSLANLIAMGTSARNIVLIGDQMQLSQPIQGVHPGRSGESCLEYLLNGMATIPPEQGIFLKTTWRMHPDVCRFISEAVYDGRLKPYPLNKRQCLILNNKAHPLLRPRGIYFVPIDHHACSQRSEEEAQLILEIYTSLLQQRYQDKDNEEHPMTPENILIVAPYNIQVNLLKRTLPKGARVGTIDKFQGQEAEVVLVSMTTSSGDYLPRFIDFLYSKNRLNVALSRAKCLALLIANPALTTIRCRTVEQMALVNTLCWVKEYSERW